MGGEDVPKSINILGIQYEVQEKPIISRDDARKGEIDFINCVISIDEALPADSKKQVLFHEVLHAVCDLLGLYDIGEDEHKVQALATGLHLVLKENKVIFS